MSAVLTETPRPPFAGFDAQVEWIARWAVHRRRDRRVTRTELEQLARRFGLSAPQAKAWAASAGSATQWPVSAVQNMGQYCGGVEALDRFVLAVLIRTESRRRLAPPSPRNRPRRSQAAAAVGCSGQITSGALVPPRPLPQIVEEFCVDRPIGWSTTDWINSKS